MNFNTTATIVGMLGFVALLALHACFPALTPEGARIQAVSREYAEGCERLGKVVAISPNRQQAEKSTGHNSLNIARNKVAALGGDAMIIHVRDRVVTHGRGLGYESRVEAVRCERRAD